MNIDTVGKVCLTLKLLDLSETCLLCHSQCDLVPKVPSLRQRHTGDAWYVTLCLTAILQGARLEIRIHRPQFAQTYRGTANPNVQNYNGDFCSLLVAFPCAKRLAQFQV
eukprot:3796964-Pleurochrysis_carterae.AAC.2